MKSADLELARDILERCNCKQRVLMAGNEKLFGNIAKCKPSGGFDADGT